MKHLLSTRDLDRDDRDPAARHRRGHGRDAAARGQEAADPARQDRRQPVLRGLHPHPHLVRGRRQAALGRRDQLLAPRARASPRANRLQDTAQTLEAIGADVDRHPPRLLGRPAGARGRAAGSTPACSTPATARTSTPPRPCSTPSPCAGGIHGDASRGPALDGVRVADRRRHPALAGRPLERLAAQHPRRRGHARRSADAPPARHRRLAGDASASTSTPPSPTRTRTP